MGSKDLTLFEAASIVAGLGVGGGVMAVPHLAAMNGLAPLLLVMAVAYIISLLLHLMVAQMVTRAGGDSQLVELFGRYLFRGRLGPALTWIFFVLIVVTFYALLAGYIVGCGEVLSSTARAPLWVAELLVYAVAAGVVFLGLKAIGLSEKYAIIAIAVILAAMAAGTFRAPFNRLPLLDVHGKRMLACYGMLMFSLSCFFSVPQAVEGLSWNKKLIPWAVAVGLGINLLFVFVITLLSLLVSENVTEVAVIGWGEAVGGWAMVLGSVFAFMAMLTSYWGVSYALAVIVRERLGLSERISWVIATLPTLVVALSGLTGFLGFMQIAGGAVALMVAVQVVPAWRRSWKESPAEPGGVLDRTLANTAVQALVVAGYVLMAVGAAIPLE